MVANDFRDRKIMHWICTESLTLRIQKYLARHTTSRPSCRPNPFKNFRVTRVSVRLHPFKIFVSHVSVWLHPCKNFFHPCIHSPDPFRTARLSVSHPCACRAFIPKECFRVRGHIYLQVRSDQRGEFHISHTILSSYRTHVMLSVQQGRDSWTAHLYI